MKKMIFFLIVFLTNISICQASSNITYFYGEPIIVNDPNIKILSNEFSIDIINSKVNNIFYLKNTSSEIISVSFIIPIENKEYSIFADNIEIKLNNTRVSFNRNDNGDYIVYTKINANSGKKLEISYNTENNLNNAKVIKYNMDNFRGKIIEKVKIQIKIDEKNIPLVEKIYPGHFEFDETTNTIGVEYYNYEVTPITKDVIVQKETFDNLLYGREIELDDKTRILIQDWSNGITDQVRLFKGMSPYEFQGRIPIYIGNYLNKNGSVGLGSGIKIGNPVLHYLYGYKKSENEFAYLSNKTICIDFVETEADVDLYRKCGELIYKIPESEEFWNIIEQGIDYDKMNYHEQEKIRKENIKKYIFSGDYDYIDYDYGDPGLYKYIYKNDYTEREYLKVTGPWASTYGARIIYVGCGIDGEKLGATEEDIIKYNNSINADLYMRVMLYDDILRKDEYGYYLDKPVIGYYDNKNEEIASVLKNGKYGYDNGILKLIKNDYIKNNSEIPTIVYFSFCREYEEGKYVVDYISSYTDGIGENTYVALNTKSAQDLLQKNRDKNDDIKQKNEKLINELEIIENEENIQNEIKEEQSNIISKDNNKSKAKKDIISIVFVGIVGICVTMIIIYVIRSYHL